MLVILWPEGGRLLSPAFEYEHPAGYGLCQLATATIRWVRTELREILASKSGGQSKVTEIHRISVALFLFSSLFLAVDFRGARPTQAVTHTGTWSG